MKKSFISLLTATITLVITSNTVSATGFDQFTNAEVHSCLGKTIDVVCAKNYGDYATCDVLDNDYYNDLTIVRNNYYHEFKSDFYSEDTAEKVLYLINGEYSQSASVNGLPFKGFTLGAKNRFTIANNFSYSNYYSRSFVEFVGQYDEAKYYIPNATTSIKKNEFKNNLSTNFIVSLNDLSEGELSYAEFFKSFGTHIITNYVAGDRIYCDGYMVSNETVISDKFASSFKQSLEVTFDNFSAGSEKSIDIEAEFDFSSDKSAYNFAISCASGKPYNASKFSDLSNNLEKWCNDLSNCQNTVVGYDFNNLIPIWEVLPTNSPISKTKMINEFFKYKNANEINYEFNDLEFNIELPETKELIRKDKKPIDDEDRFTYTDKNIVLDKTYGLDIIKDAYKEIEFTISFDAKRVNKGYQYVYLYNKKDADNKSYNDFLYESDDFDLTSKYKNYTRTFTVDTSKIKDYDLVLVWRAKGEGEDRWINEKVYLTIKYIRK